MRNNQVCTLTVKEIQKLMSLPENPLGLSGHKDYNLILTDFDKEYQASHDTITIDDSLFPILDIFLEGEEFNDTELGILICTSEI